MFFDTSRPGENVRVIDIPAYDDSAEEPLLPVLASVQVPWGAVADKEVVPSAVQYTMVSAVLMPGTGSVSQGAGFAATGSVRVAELAVRLAAERERQLLFAEDATELKRWTDARAAGGDGEDDDDDDLGAGSGAGGGQRDSGAAGARQKRSKTKFVKLSEEDFEVDWYDVLSIPDGDVATDDDIKAAYRRRCLETHPDKVAGGSDELFKRVQKAFDILGDPDTRESYDSSRPFDDSIPPEDKTYANDDEFFAAFSPVFERNKKWCSFPLPSLGSASTNIKTVQRFYDAWGRYHSWRDFSHLAELTEIDEMMSRDEKRFYSRENERELSHFRKEEQKRIRNLVERAKRADPRLRRHRDAEEAKREQSREAREAFRRQLRAAEDAKREEKLREERRLQEEAQQRAQEEKNAIRDAQRKVHTFFKENNLLDTTPANKLLATAVRQVNVQWLFGRINDSAEARQTADVVTSASVKERPRSSDSADERELEGPTAVDAVIAFNRALLAKEVQLGVNRYGEALKKATPGGSNNAAAAKPQTAAAGAASSAAKVWDEEDLSRLHKATAKYPPGTIERWAKISALLHNKFTPEEAMAKVNELTAALNSRTAATTATAAPAADSTASVEDWTVKQQKQLEAVLRELKDYKEKDKFQKIAERVDGKTAKECFDRFKFLRSVAKQK